jgi:hypothetical protein
MGVLLQMSQSVVPKKKPSDGLGSFRTDPIDTQPENGKAREIQGAEKEKDR